MSTGQATEERRLRFDYGVIDRLSSDLAHYVVTRPQRLVPVIVLGIAFGVLGYAIRGWITALIFVAFSALAASLWVISVKRATSRALRKQLKPGIRTARFFDDEWHFTDPESATQVLYSAYSRAFRYRSSVVLVGAGGQSGLVPGELFPENMLGRFGSVPSGQPRSLVSSD
ncbi:hypothetical protein [Schumannella luteola]